MQTTVRDFWYKEQFLIVRESREWYVGAGYIGDKSWWQKDKDLDVLINKFKSDVDNNE